MIELTGNTLGLHDVVHVARQKAPIAVAAQAWDGVKASRAVVDALVERGEIAYGITTGFGEFAHVSIEPNQVRQLQRNLIMSHAVGVGQPLARDVVRAMMVIRANTLVKGLSGVRPLIIERLLDLLNRDLVPVVPSRGSVGASGDLAPLAHMALSLLGLGKLDDGNGPRPANEVLAEAGFEAIDLEAKEGLALINGTQMMSAIGVLAVVDAEALLHDAQIVAGMSLEALLGSLAPFDERVHAARSHPGQARVAANMRRLCAGSSIMDSHVGCSRVQDAYSLRCIPQVLGACADVVASARTTLDIEINSATDNPLVFPNGDIISQGNFHGEPLAFALDSLAIAMSEVASISERRVERLVNPDLSEGLRPFLVESGGLNSGYMIAQYVAAALVSENKVYAHPASVDSIPTSANQEDHVSMGSIGALKLQQVMENVANVVAIEAMCAGQALDFKADEGLQPGPGSAAAHKALRQIVARLDADRILHDDLVLIGKAMSEGALRNAVSAANINLS